jgi:hypothetical protein
MAVSLTASLARWRDNLIDLTRRNPLLFLRPTKSAYLNVARPTAEEVFDRLWRQGKSWAFWMPPVEEDEEAKEEEGPATVWDLKRLRPADNELVCDDLGRKQLLRVLTNLYRRSHTDFQERGLRILHLGFGILEWRDPDKNDLVRSPLVLLPVELTRPSIRENFRLSAVEEEPYLNPALLTRVAQEDMKLRLPALPDDWDESKLADYFTAVQAAVSTLPGWHVEPATLLTLFSFFKGVMYQDLIDNEERVRQHPLIRVLARDANAEALPNPELPGERDLDRVETPEETFHILDADASQRLCLEAAARGQSFVLKGPPGTGKSQTIANLIADSLAKGKKVLFVSEKMAALEVVYNRLRHVGLGNFCLELHSHKANKRAVVAELRRCLEERHEAGSDGEEFHNLSQRRDQLNRYVEALHRPRPPWNKSVRWALAELVRRDALPGIPMGEQDQQPEQMTPAWRDDAEQAVKRAAQLGHIVEQGPAYPWWGFRADTYSLALRDEAGRLLDKVSKALDAVRQPVQEYATKVGADIGIFALVELADHLQANPCKLNAAWLTTPDLPRVAEEARRCAEEQRRFMLERDRINSAYRPDVWKTSEGTAAAVKHSWHEAAAWLAPGDERGAHLLAHEQALRGWAADTQKRLPTWGSEVRTLEKWLGLALPAGARDAGESSKMNVSPGEVRLLLRLANLCQAEAPPERRWLTDPAVREQVRGLLGSARPRFDEFHHTKAELRKRYKEEFFQLDLTYLEQRFAGPYRSWLRFFNMQFRRDRRAISRRSVAGYMPSSIREDVVAAAGLMRLKSELEAAGVVRQKSLGRYEKGLATDWVAVEKALHVADEGVELARKLGYATLPDRLADALSGAATATDKIKAALKRLKESLAHWSHATHDLAAYLPAALVSGRSMDDSTLSAISQYAHEMQADLNYFAGLTDPVLGLARARPADTQALLEDVQAVEAVNAWEAALVREEPQRRELFGPAYERAATDWGALKRSLVWSTRLRELLGGRPAPDRLTQMAMGEKSALPASEGLRRAAGQFEPEWSELEKRYEAPAPQFLPSPPRGEGSNYPRLRDLPAEALKQRLQQMRQRTGELSDWVDWRKLADRFAQLRLSGFWQNVPQHQPAKDQLLDCFTKSMLSRWLEAVFAQDVCLRDFRRAEHEQVLAEFRALDREWIRHTARRVALLADARRPQTPAAIPGSETATLLNEAHKKSRHLPVRKLFEKIPNLLLQLKPCLLMSPLSVSQFLHPEKIQFDLVVFDEASQIRPEDALGPIYRGSQVVVTGDDRQLPPTAFFQLNLDDEDDEEVEEAPSLFESVLDAYLGAGLPLRMLRWHYRSRHEALIAYSNQTFYDNALVTFPSARAQHPELGVAFHHVPDGVYDRGGRRDNAREAQVVADLVFEHFRDRPDKTLGVIAFSQAQMNAVEDEIDRRLEEHPELEQHFREDRLSGFFVKNLETVQGDERDVILLSVGYGPDAVGHLTMNFGPLNREGGQRRLNVAVTRAREHLMVVSSLRAEDIDLNAARSQGAQQLRRYLAYAERGLDTLETSQQQGKGEPESPLETNVLGELRRLGFDAVPQVGCSGFRMDLGVIDPRVPGQFLLGLEGDGATYHAGATARDRDRLRQEVLEGLGWRIHRVWSPAWTFRRFEEVERLRLALEDAQKNQAPPRAEAPAAPLELPTRRVEIGENDGPVSLVGTIPYRVAELRVGVDFARLEMHADRARKEIARLLHQLVKVEGPLHLDVAVRRLRAAWGLERTGERIRQAVEDAAAECEKKDRLRRQGEFLWPVGEAEVKVRVPTDAAESQRDLEQIAPEELQEAMRLLVEQGGGLGEDVLLTQTARVFGFRNVGDNMRELLRGCLQALQEQGVCATNAGAVTLRQFS